MDRLQQWYADLITNHHEEALQRVEERGGREISDQLLSCSD